jgi:hypothetical protein
VIPGHLRDLEDYWYWLESLLDRSGGYLQEGFLIVEPISMGDDGEPPWLTLDVPRQTLRFHDGSFLSFQLVVDVHLGSVEYSYHYARSVGELVWRHDKHPGHEAEHGGPTHRHLGDGRRVFEDDVDLADVLEEILADQQGLGLAPDA